MPPNPAPASTPTPVEDSFIVLSARTWTGLRHAVLECSWIADGGDPTASQLDRDEAVENRLRFEREKIRVSERSLAYYAKMLSIKPPSNKDVAEASEIAERLANMHPVNVKVSAVISAADELIKIYSKTNA